jgi:small subunit ribosomal protein S20
MPNIRSAAKRMRQDKKRNMVNRMNKSRLRTALRTFDAAEDKQAALPATYKAIDKAVTKGVMHRNTGDRKKAQVAKKAQAEQ